MKWTEHKGGISRSEEGHIIVQRGPKEWELTTPDGRTHRFVDAVQAKQFVEGVPESESDEEPKPKPDKKAAAAATKKATAKPAAGPTADDSDVTDRHHKKLLKYLERAATAAEALELPELVAALRQRPEWPPSSEDGERLREAVPDGADDRVVKTVGQIASRLVENPDDAEAANGKKSGPDLYLERVYSRVLTLERVAKG